METSLTVGPILDDIWRADSRFAPCQWEMALLCNDVSHWLDASLESALYLERISQMVYELIIQLSPNILQY